MAKGIEILDLTIGSGEEAREGKTVAVKLRMFLNQGEEVFVYPEPRVRIDLTRRQCIAGLRKGIIGMRVGGTRALVISPHFAYGSKGVPGKVPPNALLRYEVELLDVQELGAREPEDFLLGKSLLIFRPGESARDLPRWQFKMGEDGHCGVFISIPIPGVSWRHTRSKMLEWHLDREAAAKLIDEVMSLPSRFPQECLSPDALWSDSSEPANGITRDRETDTLCLSISVSERGQMLSSYAVKESSPSLLSSELHRTIQLHIESRLNADSESGSAASPSE